MLKRILQILLYLSLLFLAVYLYAQDSFKIPKVTSIYLILFSILFASLGFLLDSRAWQIILRNELSRVTFKDAFISTGKYIFSKYIPGKFWVILGRAGYLSLKYKSPLLVLGSLSFYYQLISLISATVLGLGIFLYIDYSIFLYGIFSLILILILFIGFQGRALNIVSQIISFIFRKNVELPKVPLGITSHVFFVSIANWLIWSLSFYLFLLSVHSNGALPLATGLIFPASSVLGIIVLIAPGGIGIRESLLAIGLTLFGVSVNEAASIALFSRVWFLFVELLYFISAILLSRLRSTSYEKPLEG